jgi:hypothetical protein
MSEWLIDSVPTVDYKKLAAPEVLTRLTVTELHLLDQKVRDEIVSRLLAEGDLDAISDDVFTTTGFLPNMLPALPWVNADGVLICPGTKAHKSKTSHDCVFVSVDSHWVWNHPDALSDAMRTTVTNGKTLTQSVTLLPVMSGMEVDVVTSAARSGPCKAKHVDSFTFNGTTLLRVPARTRAAAEHR